MPPSRFPRRALPFALGGLYALSTGKEIGLEGGVGVTTGSFMRHLSHRSAPGKLRLLDLPQILVEQLDMRIIDLMSETLESFEPAYLGKLRSESERHGCVLTNLKLNQRGLDMASPVEEERRRALRVYRGGVDAAKFLGCRWVRPIPHRGGAPDLDRLTASYRELIDYAGERGIRVLIENFGWLSKDPDSLLAVVDRVGKGRLEVCPDTGNWTNEARYPGLARVFPRAVTCDFKAFQLEPDGSHPRYDLRRCFDTGWKAGFRGPWCIEHFHRTLEGQLEGFGIIRDRLRKWMAEA